MFAPDIAVAAAPATRAAAPTLASVPAASAASRAIPPAPWARWRTHFEGNACRPLPRPENHASDVPVAIAAALARALARFQIGETGEGSIVGALARVAMPGIDDDYRRALELFVREEHRHARILADLVRGLGGQLLASSWTEVPCGWPRALFLGAFTALACGGTAVVGWDLRAPLRVLGISQRDLRARVRVAVQEAAR